MPWFLLCYIYIVHERYIFFQKPKLSSRSDSPFADRWFGNLP
jgi:hypothetical protein